MKKLWNSKDYTLFEPVKHNIAETFALKKNFLPYTRKYNNLSYGELIKLIKDAKKYHWQALDLSNCGIEYFPDELWELRELRILYLGNNSFEHTGDNNTFRKIPQKIEQLESLQVLDLSGQQIKFEDDHTLYLPNLLYLNIHNCNYSKIPKPLLIPSLIGICYSCSDSSLLDDLFSLVNLQYLSLSASQISSLPDSLGNLGSLQLLNLSGCVIHSLPDSLGNLGNLQFLDLSHSQISSLPDSLGNLGNLQFLDLSHSQISSLPDSLGNLGNLRFLDLSHSQISLFPNSLENLRNLHNFTLSSTPLAEKIPPEIFNQSAIEVIRYVLSQQSTDEKTYFYESKMIIVGQGHVGKTSILNRIVNNTYLDEPSTEGIDISSWHFKQQEITYKLNVWDFGGQEIYHATHQFFLTRRSLYLLVWDILAEDEYGRIDYWLKTIQSLAGDSPIILVVNKCDRGVGRRKNIDADDYQKRFPQIQGIFYVSCKDNVGFPRLKKCIKNTAVNLPLMETLWLNSWLAVRNRLETMAETENYISYRKYFSICQENGITEEEALRLAKYLHDLGVILYYHDDPLLKHLIILSSEWGTDAVYKILDEQVHRLKGRNGIFYIDDLPYIWKDKSRYPEEFYPHLLNLMEKFQLTFKVNANTYLMAELLDGKAIELPLKFPRENTLSFRYDYDFLPAGIMTRFIVSMNQYIITIDGVKQCWKKGVYLEYGSAYALVKLSDSITEKFVSIQVSGSNKRDKQEFLFLIRHSIEKINSLFSQINITKLIPCICSSECTHLFKYDVLLEAEKRGRKTLMCEKSFKDVLISKLLDGVENMENKENKYGYYGSPINFAPNIAVNPTITNTNTNTNTSSADATNTISITQEIKEYLYDMEGNLKNIRSVLNTDDKEISQELDMAESAIKELSECKTNVDVKKSGIPSRLETFFEDSQDTDTSFGKAVQGTKQAGKFLKKLAEIYNKIATHLHLHKIPFVK